MTLAWAQKAPCRDGLWAQDRQYRLLCYSDVIALYGSEGLVAGRTPYVDVPVEYPVGIGAVMAAASAAARWWPVAERYPSFYGLTWVELAVATLALVWSTALLAGRRRWDAAMLALAPALVVHAITNWDLAAAALAGLAMLAWARRRPVLAGVLLGLATATKLYPALFLVPLLALCLRADRLRSWALTAAASLATVVLACLPAYVAAPAFAAGPDGALVAVAPSAWSQLLAGGPGAFMAALAPHRGGGANALLRFVDLNRTRPANWDSLWFVLQHVTGHPLDRVGPIDGAPGRLNAAVFAGLLLTMAAVVVLALRAPRRPRLPQLYFLALVGFMLTNKVHSPQYVVWLLPLAVLARPSWPAFLAWQARNAGQDGRASTASGSSQTTYCGECTMLVSMNPTKARKYSCGSRGRRGARSASNTTAAMVSNRPANTAALSRPGAPSIGPTRSSGCPVTCCSANHSESQSAGRVRFKSTNRSSAFAPPPRCGARAAIKAPGPPASNCDHALGATATNAPSGPAANAGAATYAGRQARTTVASEAAAVSAHDRSRSARRQRANSGTRNSAG